MMDPATTSAVIGGLVATLSAYMNYKVGMRKFEQENTAKPAEPDKQIIDQAEAALPVIRSAVEQYGNEDEQADLTSFERNPQRNAGNLERTLTDIATRQPAFAQQLQTLAQQANIQSGGVHISGGTVYGGVTGHNTGTQTNTYNFGNHDKK